MVRFRIVQLVCGQATHLTLANRHHFQTPEGTRNIVTILVSNCAHSGLQSQFKTDVWKTLPVGVCLFGLTSGGEEGVFWVDWHMGEGHWLGKWAAWVLRYISSFGFKEFELWANHDVFSILMRKPVAFGDPRGQPRDVIS